MDNEEKKQEHEGEFTVSLEAYLPDNLAVHFASHFNVVDTGNEIYLSFFQIELPAVDSSHPVEKNQKIKNKCVARIVLTHAGAKTLQKALDSNLNRTAGDSKQTDNS